MIAKIRDPKPAVNQNIQLIAAEQKEPEPRVIIVTCSGASTSRTSQNTEKNTGPEWVRKATNKSTPLDLQKNKETFQQAKTFFTEPTASGSQVLSFRGVLQKTPCGLSHVENSQATTSGRCDEDESTGSVQSFLWSFLKLVRNEKAIRELQCIIDQYPPSSSMSSAQPAVHNIMGHTRTGREMRLRAQVGEFEMDEVILDLGSEVNFLTKQTWEHMGSPKLHRSPIHLRLANQ